jgi:Domain of unknown function (DUF4337)
MPELLEMAEEHEERGENPLVIPVTVTLAILAVLVAMATLLGHRTHTEEILLQGSANDQWAYYQAKNSRAHEMRSTADLLTTLTSGDKEKAATLAEKYNKEAERYDKEKEEAGEKARDFEKEKDALTKRADRFDAAEVLLEIALIICSLTLLTKKKFFWMVGILVGVFGAVAAASAFLLH